MWPEGRDFDVVVGNPPFQGQLGRHTARTASENRSLRSLLGEAALGYADTATLFLVRAIDLVASGGFGRAGAAAVRSSPPVTRVPAHTRNSVAVSA